MAEETREQIIARLSRQIPLPPPPIVRGRVRQAHPCLMWLMWSGMLKSRTALGLSEADRAAALERERERKAERERRVQEGLDVSSDDSLGPQCVRNAKAALAARLQDSSFLRRLSDTKNASTDSGTVVDEELENATPSEHNSVQLLCFPTHLLWLNGAV